MERLRYIREQTGYSQQDLADESGVSQHTISEIELGRRKPQGRTLRKLAKVLDVQVAALYGESEYPLGEAPPLQASFNHLLAEERRQWKLKVESFIAEAGEVLDSPDLTQDVAFHIVMDGADLFLKTAEEKGSASREKGYTYKELNDLSAAYDLIAKFNERANMVFQNRFGGSASDRELEELEERKAQMRRLPTQRQDTA